MLDKRNLPEFYGIQDLDIVEAHISTCFGEYITLSDKDIRPCKGCYSCQHIEGHYGCVQNDDAPQIMESIIKSGYVILATPIYTWYCTAAY